VLSAEFTAASNMIQFHGSLRHDSDDMRCLVKLDNWRFNGRLEIVNKGKKRRIRLAKQKPGSDMQFCNHIVFDGEYDI